MEFQQHYLLLWKSTVISISMSCAKFTSLGVIAQIIANLGLMVQWCRNPSFRFTTKAKGLQGCGPRRSSGVKAKRSQGCEPRRSSGVTSHTPKSVRKCEGVNFHIPKATPTLGDGVPVDFQNFRNWFQGSKFNGLWCSLYHWKAPKT